MVTLPTCRHCKHQSLIEHQYIYDGVLHDDSYCGWCGKNWPRPVAVLDARERPARPTSSQDEDPPKPEPL